MFRRYQILLVSLSLASCAAPKGATAVAPSAATTPAPSSMSAKVPGAAAPNVTLQLEASACTHRGYGCGSCVTDGIWGALSVDDDCSLRCNQWCGGQPANVPPAVALGAIVSGPNVVEMKVTLPTEVVIPRKSDQTKKKVNAAAAAESVSIVEKTSAFTYFATHDSISCGLLGPSTSATTCNPPLLAHCGCESSGIWGKANCDCRPATAAHSTGVNNCHIDAHPHLSCPTAGLNDVNDPGCVTKCAAGYTGVCKESSCAGNTWTQSICACLPL